jgi:hypothetical protein
MSRYALGHLSHSALTAALRASVRDTRAATALLLAHIAEFDARELYVPAAHPSMCSYLVHELGFGEQAALKRLRAARTAREFPVIFTAVADGRLTLTAVVVLATHLTVENAARLIATAEGMSIGELQRTVCGRSREPELPLIDETMATTCNDASLSSRTVELTQCLAETPAALAPAVPAAVPQERLEVRFTVSREAHDMMLYAKALLGHAIPNGDPGAVFERAMTALVRLLEKRKFAATDRPRQRRAARSSRHVPAAVKRAVWARDQGRCTFVSDDGKRCPACTLLEWDHVTGVARGATATVGEIRLRCRTHNQYAAELMYGKEFMRHKREQAREAAAKRREARASRVAEAPPARTSPRDATHPRPSPGNVVMQVEATSEADEEAVSWLQMFGYAVEDARRVLNECGPRISPESRRLECLLQLRSRHAAPSRSVA